MKSLHYLMIQNCYKVASGKKLSDFFSLWKKGKFLLFKEELQSAHIICNKNIFAILKLPSNHFAYYFIHSEILYLPNMLQKSPSTESGCIHFNCGQLKRLSVHFLDLHRHASSSAALIGPLMTHPPCLPGKLSQE